MLLHKLDASLVAEAVLIGNSVDITAIKSAQEWTASWVRSVLTRLLNPAAFM